MQQLNILDEIKDDEVVEDLEEFDSISEGWKEYTLGDLLILNYGKSLPERNRIEGKIPVYSSSGITGWHNSSIVEKEAVIVGRKGSVGTVFYSDKPFFCIDTAYYITENKEKYDLKYVYYLLKTLSLNTLNEDSAVPGLNRNTAYAQKFLLPELNKQKQIAKILSSLDDKIELNQKMNKTLEEMAQAIFKHWFIENLEDNWQTSNLKDICSLITDGKHGDCKNEFDSGYYFVSAKDVKDGKINYSNVRQITKEDFEETHRRTNLEAWDVLVTNSGTIGRMGIVRNIPETKRTTFQKSVAILKPKEGISKGSYLYFLLKENSKSIIELAGGTTQKNLLLGDIRAFEFKYPGIKLIKEFDIIVNPLLENIFVNDNEIKNLTEIRDSLLPKLMSGEIRTTHPPTPSLSKEKGR